MQNDEDDFIVKRLPYDTNWEPPVFCDHRPMTPEEVVALFNKIFQDS